MEAAKACKVRTIVIRRPRQKAGLNMEESKEMLWKLAEDMVQREEEKLKQKEGRQEEQGELVKDIDQKEKAEWEQKGEGKENGQKGCRQLSGRDKSLKTVSDYIWCAADAPGCEGMDREKQKGSGIFWRGYKIMAYGSSPGKDSSRCLFRRYGLLQRLPPDGGNVGAGSGGL